MKSVRKKFLSVLLCISMVLPMSVPNLTVTADESEKYPYAVYAASADAGAICVNAGYLCVNGSMATRGTVVMNDGPSNINGAVIEHVERDMIYMQNKLDSIYFNGESNVWNEDCVLENQNLNHALIVNGDFSAEGSLCFNASVQSVGNMKIAGDILNANNCCLYSQSGDILIDSNSVSFSGLIYAPSGTVCFDSETVNLNSVIVIAQKVEINAANVNISYDARLAELIGNESEAAKEEYQVYAYGLYHAETESITIKWVTNCLADNAQIWESDDNELYTLARSVSNSGLYEYQIREEFDRKYFKVVLPIGEDETVECIPFIISRTEDGYVCEFIDTDEDGVTDVYEMYIGTDPENPDTDGDGISDYEEIKNGTDPLDASSTEREMPEERKDTDGDGIPDDEEIYVQMVPGSDASLSEINTEENGYTLSVEITASGFAPRQITVEESVYAETVRNSALFGTVIDVDYNSAYEVQDCTLVFTIRDGSIENVNGKYAEYSEEYKGIKRFLVFRYDEDIHMLLPIETEYDVERNAVSCKASELGTYCLIDMEQWLDNIGFEVHDTQSVTMETDIAVEEYATAAVLNVPDAYSGDNTVTEIRQEMQTAVFNGHTYGIYSGSEVLSWTEAKEMCERLGGHLVSVNSQAEQDFIHELANTDYATKGLYWIGAYRNEGNMEWYWCDGTPFAYTNWAEGEPNYEASREFYVHMYQSSGEWNDTLNFLPGTGFYYTSNCGFICEWDSVVVGGVYTILLGSSWEGVALVAELSPEQSADTDLDGLTDWEEVDNQSDLITYNNGKPVFPTVQRMRDLGYEINFPEVKIAGLKGLPDFLANIVIVPCLSNPAKADTDGDGLIDSKDPEPMKVFDDRFYITDNFDDEPTIDFVERHVKRGEMCHFTEYINPFSPYIFELFFYTAMAGGSFPVVPFLVYDDMEDTSFFSMLKASPDFCRLLLYYLSGFGGTYYLTEGQMKDVIFEQTSNEEHYWYNINQVVDVAEEILMLDSSSDERVYISTTSGNNFKSACYKGNFCRSHKGGYDDGDAVNWGYAIGEALCAMTAEVYIEEGRYCMNLKYYLIDNYEFPVHWDQHDADDWLTRNAHILHEQALAKEFKIVGVYSTSFTWEKGENVGGDYKEIIIDSESYDAKPIS